MNREKILSIAVAILLATTIALSVLYYLEYERRESIESKYESLNSAFEDLESKYNQVLNDIGEYLNSFVNVTVPIYNESGVVIDYLKIQVPTKTLSIENYTLSGVTGLIEVTVIIQYSEDDYEVHTAYIVEGSDALAATLSVANVDYTLGAYGAFVNGINGVYGDWANEGTWWSLWYWDSNEKSWKLSEVGASSLKVEDGSIIAWVLTRGYPPEITPTFVPEG